MATVFETYGVIRADGTLELEHKFAGPPRRVKVRVESIEVPDAEFARRFAELTATWREATRFSSKMKARLEHPAFREIVAMGENAVPLLLSELEKNGGFGFLILQEITGVEPPIPEGFPGNRAIHAGWVAWDIEGMQAAWLAWGLANGYRWEHVV